MFYTFLIVTFTLTSSRDIKALKKKLQISKYQLNKDETLTNIRKTNNQAFQQNGTNTKQSVVNFAFFKSFIPSLHLGHTLNGTSLKLSIAL